MSSFTKEKRGLRVWMRALVVLVMVGISVAGVLFMAEQTVLVTVLDGDTSVTVMTTQTQTEQRLKVAGITLNEHDRVVQVFAEKYTVVLKVERACSVTVKADGRQFPVILYGGTVSDALNAANVTLQEHDRCSAPLQSPLKNGMQIAVDRITFRDVTAVEKVPFQTVKIKDSNRLQGKTKVKTAGVLGERTIVTREKLVNGTVVSREEISNKITKKPVDKVVLVGTKILPVVNVKPQQTTAVISQMTATGKTPSSATWRAQVRPDGTLIDHEGKPVSYQAMISGKATAYYAKPGAGTATGRKARYGVVAVNPKTIPYGTMLYICSPDGKTVYGYAVAGDTGGTLLAGTVLVDLYYNNYDQCVWFSTRKMNVYVLK